MQGRFNFEPGRRVFGWESKVLHAGVSKEIIFYFKKLLQRRLL